MQIPVVLYIQVCLHKTLVTKHTFCSKWALCHFSNVLCCVVHCSVRRVAQVVLQHPITPFVYLSLYFKVFIASWFDSSWTVIVTVCADASPWMYCKSLNLKFLLRIYLNLVSLHVLAVHFFPLCLVSCFSEVVAISFCGLVLVKFLFVSTTYSCQIPALGSILKPLFMITNIM